MDLTAARCFVTVTDPDKALAFYRDVLGLELVMDVPNGDTAGSPWARSRSPAYRSF